MHGGDIYNQIIDMDFSVNINPLGPPESVVLAIKQAVGKIENYPDISVSRLREALADKTGISAENIICGNGASELIMAAINAINPDRVYLACPCFTGYENCLIGRTAEVIWLDSDNISSSLESITLASQSKKEEYQCNNEKNIEITVEKAIDKSIDKTRATGLMILTNPNNPDGRCYTSSSLRTVADICKRNNIILMLDECFSKLSDEPEHTSFIKYLHEYENVIILDAFTKSFAIPGVRLGYMLFSSEDLKGRVKQRLPEWNVSVIAEAAGIAALSEDTYLAKARELIKKERGYLSECLIELGFRVYPSSANFIMFKDESKTVRLYDELLKRGTLIRNCADYRGLDEYTFRIAVKCEKENKKLINQIEVIYEEYRICASGRNREEKL